MKVRLIIVTRAIAGAMLMAVTVAGCTGGSPSSSAPSIFTPQPATQSPSAPASGPARTPTVGQSTASGKATSSARATGKASGKATPTPRPSATRKSTPKATPTSHRPSPAHTSAPVATPYPTSAPETGGGGTAGLQDGLLFGIGGAAIVAGLGSLGYRRRLRRKHRADTTASRTDTPAGTGIR